METLEKETKGLEDWVRGVMVEDWAVCGVRGVSEECKFSMQCAIRSRIVKHTTVHEVPQGSMYACIGSMYSTVAGLFTGSIDVVWCTI